MKTLPIGKLPLEQLQRLLQKYAPADVDPRVIVGPGIGEDAAVIDFGATYLVAKTDPITFVADDIGWYVIVVNANDIATRGAVPKWFLATILLPAQTTTEASVETIFAQLHAACQAHHITLCGGHTEVTYGLDRPLVIGQMLGEVAKDRLISTSGARVGDNLLLTKGLAIEATSILARVKDAELRAKYPSEFLDRCKQFIFTPGLSVVQEALAAVALGGVSAMHDPTEGGLATALHELAEAAGVGLRIDAAAIPIYPETRQLCQEYGLNPLGVIASGALLLTVAPAHTARLIEGLRAQGVAVTVIGEVVPSAAGRSLTDGAKVTALPIFHQDELTKIFV